MNYLFSGLVAIILFYGCIKCKDVTVSDCLEEKFENFKKESGAVSIERYKLKKENKYWYLLNKNASNFEGCDPFIDEQCNHICSLCGDIIPFPTCIEEVDFDATIWKK